MKRWKGIRKRRRKRREGRMKGGGGGGGGGGRGNLGSTKRVVKKSDRYYGVLYVV